jgi:hypothetical protein
MTGFWVLKSCYNRASTLSSDGSLSRVLVTITGTRGLVLVDALEGVQVYQHVDQGIVVGDGWATAQLGPLDAEFLGPGVDAFGGHTLLVDVLVEVIVAVDRVFEEPEV